MRFDSGRSHVLTRSTTPTDCSTGAMYLETLTAKVSSMTAPFPEKAEAFSVRGSGPQGLRRPRFSFFRFTCQTARQPCGCLSLLGGEPAREPTKPIPRHLLGGCFPHISEELPTRQDAVSAAARRMAGVIWPTSCRVNRERFDSLPRAKSSRLQQLSGL